MNHLSSLSAIVAVTLSTGSVHAATSLISAPSLERNDFSGIVGYRFTSTNATTEINYLGFVDDGLDGNDVAHQVGLYLWNGSNYVLQRSVTVGAGTGDTLHDGYRWVSVPTITLSDTGTTFWLVAATVTSGDGDFWGETGTLEAAIGALSFGDGYYDGANFSLTDPLALGGGQGFYSFYNPGNIATAVPEPGAAVLGILGWIALCRRRR